MSCQFYSEVVRLMDGGSDDARSFEMHASSCAECGPALLELRDARQVLSSHAVFVNPASRVRVWTSMQTARGSESRSSFAKLVFAGVAASAIGVAIVMLAPGPNAIEPQAGQLTAEGEPQRIELPRGAGTIEIAKGSQAEIRMPELELQAIVLDDGKVEGAIVRTDDVEPIEIITKQVRIRVLSGKFRVSVEGGKTIVDADGGAVSLWEQGAMLPRSIEGRAHVEIARDPATEHADRSAHGAEPTIRADASAHGAEHAIRSDAIAHGANRAGASRADNATPHRANTSLLSADPIARADTSALGAKPAARVDPSSPAACPPGTDCARERDDLDAARRALTSDAPTAARIAEKVIEERPPEPLEADALAILADAQRRRGLVAEAALLYAKLARHPGGTPYREEAHLRRAMLLADLGDLTTAISELRTLEDAFAHGPTAPERAALEAKLLLLESDPISAADAIDRAASDGISIELMKRRLDVAEKLAASSPDRARELLAPLLESTAPASLRRAAQALLARIRGP